MNYQIADLQVQITFAPSELNTESLIQSMTSFRIPTAHNSKLTTHNPQPLFSLHVDDSLHPAEKADLDHIKDVDTGNGITRVWQQKTGGYQFIIKDIFGNECCLLHTDATFQHCQCALNGNPTMRQFGLQNAIMLCFAFAGIKYNLVLLHASVVRQGDTAYAFTAKSGTGKSTQVANWLRCIPGCDLLNDDNPIVRIHPDGNVYIYGSPWSGKTPCYRPIRAKLGAITLIKRAPHNSVERQTNLEAFTTLLPGVSTMKWDTHIFSTICDILSLIISKVPIYTLHCLPDPSSALLCHQAISK